ncbi:FG-GAP repeat domain-containing protein [Plantactinospora sp. WMMB782]|uniref:FG-GAP repeat domain-containing protein n=1 Tax=Plantactinospora sp. WMMB782 TaxID=3404121 RepID=UPI003B963580
MKVVRYAVLTALAILGTLVVQPPAARAAVVPDCTSAAPTSADAEFAARVKPTLTRTMSQSFNASRAACVRVIVLTVKNRGLPSHAATLAITTAIVESGIQNLNHGDRDSLGLYQQRPSQGWGTESQILDPVYATNAFLGAMLRKFPNNSWLTRPVGEVCQAVQISAFPERYGEQAGDGAKIAAAAWGGHSGAAVDYDGDRRADLALYRRNAQTGSSWWVKSVSGTQLLADHRYGGASDIPAPGDYDGDGRTDLALFRRDCVNGSTWWVKAASGTQLLADHRYGGCEDVPAPGDYDGDGRTDLALFRRDCVNGSTWWVKAASGTQLLADHRYGGCEDVPAPGDYDGDGRTDLALFRRNAQTGSSWWVKSVSGTQLLADHRYGGASDIPAPGDYDGDGRTDLALYRRDCAEGSSWWVKPVSGTQLFADHKYGGCADIPAPGDYSGDGRTDLALYRRDCTDGSSWWVRNSATGANLLADHRYGGCADIPAASNPATT